MSLCCELSRTGVPVRWFKSENELCPGGRYQMKLRGNVAEMHIRNVQPEDVGEYSCVFGEQKTTAEVNVRGTWLFILRLTGPFFGVVTVFLFLSATSGSIRVLREGAGEPSCDGRKTSASVMRSLQC